MTFIVYLFLFYVSRALTLQYNLIDDNSSSGIIFFPWGKCFVFENKKTISYAVDLSILNELEGMIKVLEHDCYNERRLLDIFRKKIHEINKIRANFNIGNSSHDILITSTMEDVHSLEENLKFFYGKNSSGHCLTFRKKLSHFNNIVMEIDKLARSDFSTLERTISFSKLKRDVMNLLINYNEEDFSYSFDFSSEFVHEFLSNTEFLLRFDNTTMYLTFILPIYRQFEMSAVFPKPIILNNVSYVLDMEPKFFIQNGSYSIIYNENDWYNLCHSHRGERYCLKPELKNDCDEFITHNNNSNIDLQCLNNIIFENTAIQVDSTIYFSIVFPTPIKIICNDSIFLLTINKPSKLELGNCSIKTSFFEYGDYFGIIPYKLYRQLRSGSLEFGKKYEIVKNGGIIYFIIIYLIIMTLIVTFIYVFTKRNRNDGISFYVSTQNVDYDGRIVTTV